MISEQTHFALSIYSKNLKPPGIRRMLGASTVSFVKLLVNKQNEVLIEEFRSISTKEIRKLFFWIT